MFEKFPGLTPDVLDHTLKRLHSNIIVHPSPVSIAGLDFCFGSSNASPRSDHFFHFVEDLVTGFEITLVACGGANHLSSQFRNALFFWLSTGVVPSVAGRVVPPAIVKANFLLTIDSATGSYGASSLNGDQVYFLTAFQSPLSFTPGANDKAVD